MYILYVLLNEHQVYLFFFHIQAVYLKYKDYHSGQSEWQPEEGDGILILDKIPQGCSPILPPFPLGSKFDGVTKTFSSLKFPGAEEWFRSVLDTGKLPNHEVPIPDDFFDFKKFSYDKWKDTERELELARAQQEQIQQD